MNLLDDYLTAVVVVVRRVVKKNCVMHGRSFYSYGRSDGHYYLGRQFKHIDQDQTSSLMRQPK